jgi:hypothetical protein
LSVLPYIRVLLRRGVAGRGSTQRSHLVTAPRKALTLDPIHGRAVFGEGTSRDHGVPPPGRAGRHRAAADASRPAAEDQPPPATGRRTTRMDGEDAPGSCSPANATHRTARRPTASSRTCTRHQRQLLSPGKGVRAAARLQGKVLTLPNCSIFRFCCLSAAAGQVMPAGSRASAAGEAAPDASAQRPARQPLRARRAQRPLPGSAGSAGSSGLQAPPPRPPPAGLEEQPPRPPLRTAGCRRGREPGAAAAPGAERSRAAPRARPAPPVSPPPPPPRARLLPQHAAASASTYASAAGSGAWLVRKCPPHRRNRPWVRSMPSAAERARRFATRIPLLLVFAAAAAAAQKGGGRGLGEGRASLGTHTLDPIWEDAREPGVN